MWLRDAIFGVDKKAAPPPGGLLTMHPEYGYAYRLVHGIVYPPFAEEAAIDELRSRDWSRQGDVLVATYPKCGTTWMQQIVLLLLANGDASKVLDPMEQAPWVDREASLRRRKGASIDPVVDAEASPDFSNRRCFKTHAPYHLLPCADGFSRGKIIVVVRNPKDAAASMYSHYLGLPQFRYSGPWDHFFDLFVNGNVGHGDYFDHILGWRREACAPNILWLSFEQTASDVRGTAVQVAGFLGIDLDDAALDNVVQAASFDSMKKAHQLRVQTGAQRMGSKSHFRSGTSGGWRSRFTVAQSDQLDDIFQAKMENSDIITDYGKGLRFRGTARIPPDGDDNQKPGA
ncbi:hypothetical protein CTAYLR_006519 [Chrysophaeum taylorii]|uniref:Sulfotransferase domain-containing protein n=1 Tax=Chrysophaeum taylorii TaxID=2483200 RepID=A0AAD7UG53_9STRA|nr:hypothetical protein CTAYLR_006519 [Chrysophaeum taylorii]